MAEDKDKEQQDYSKSPDFVKGYNKADMIIEMRPDLIAGIQMPDKLETETDKGFFGRLIEYHELQKELKNFSPERLKKEYEQELKEREGKSKGSRGRDHDIEL